MAGLFLCYLNKNTFVYHLNQTLFYLYTLIKYMFTGYVYLNYRPKK